MNFKILFSPSVPTVGTLTFKIFFEGVREQGGGETNQAAAKGRQTTRRSCEPCWPRGQAEGANLRRHGREDRVPP